MNYSTLILAESILNLLLFFVTFCFFIPQAISFYQKWKQTPKVSHLTTSILFIVLSFFVLSANYISFIRVFAKRGF